jgi:hypothetical protein
MKYGPETKTVEAFLRHLNRMTPEEWAATGAAARDAAWNAAWAAARDATGAAAWNAAWAAARDATGAATGAAAWAAAGAANEIQGAAPMRERGQPFYFLPLFGFADPEAVLAADHEPDAHTDSCWALGAQHYDCALREIARQRAVIEVWREAHIDATGADQ